jgi:hypothetical protein
VTPTAATWPSAPVGSRPHPAPQGSVTPQVAVRRGGDGEGTPVAPTHGLCPCLTLLSETVSPRVGTRGDGPPPALRGHRVPWRPARRPPSIMGHHPGSQSGLDTVAVATGSPGPPRTMSNCTAGPAGRREGTVAQGVRLGGHGLCGQVRGTRNPGSRTSHEASSGQKRGLHSLARAGHTMPPPAGKQEVQATKHPESGQRFNSGPPTAHLEPWTPHSRRPRKPSTPS